MFLEWWMLGILGVWWLISVISVSNKVKLEAYSEGINQGAEMSLKVLEMKKIIAIDEGGEIRGIENKV